MSTISPLFNIRPESNQGKGNGNPLVFPQRFNLFSDRGHCLGLPRFYRLSDHAVHYHNNFTLESNYSVSRDVKGQILSTPWS